MEQRWVPVSRVGLYVPGGKAVYPSSVVMNVVPAQEAGVESQVVVSPPQAEHGPVPVLYWLAGLTCTEETFTIKAGAQQLAAELGVMLVTPDTSPRGEGVPGDPDGACTRGAGYQ